MDSSLPDDETQSKSRPAAAKSSSGSGSGGANQRSRLLSAAAAGQAVTSTSASPSESSGASTSASASGTSSSKQLQHHSQSSAEPVFIDSTSSGRRLQQKTDRSCAACRNRRVRCDRTWPECIRCKKRRETCAYGDGVTVEMTEDSTDDPQIAALQAKLYSAEKKLAQVQTTPPQPPPLPLLVTKKEPEDVTIAAEIHAAFKPLTSLEQNTISKYLASQSVARAVLGPGSIDWRLIEPQLAEMLTLHLLESSACCCCSRLSSMTPLIARIPFLKANLANLNAPQKATAAVLCALGARSSPHSAILGLEIPGLADGTADPDVFLTVGSRREKACRALLQRASNICWFGGLLTERIEQESIEVLTGVAQLLIFDEVRPRTSRFFLRNAIGMYQDLQLEMPDNELVKLRRSVGAALFREDSIHSAQLYTAPLISNSQLSDYFVDTDLTLPDLANDHLSAQLDDVLSAPTRDITVDMLQHAIQIVANWVAYLQRLFARITTVRRPHAPSVLEQAQHLWQQIDTVHVSAQRLQAFLVGFPGTPRGADDDPNVTAHLVLLAVRTDTRLVDLVNLMHEWLNRSDLLRGWGNGSAEEAQMVHDMRQESGLRIRKCLKLTAFYSRLYLASEDKHVCHHLVQQAELLPSWTTIALQRVGDPGGPPSSEFEVSHEELDWLVSGLRLSLFYTPIAFRRLLELDEGRKRRQAGESEDAQMTPAESSATDVDVSAEQPPSERTLEHFGVRGSDPGSSPYERLFNDYIQAAPSYAYQPIPPQHARQDGQYDSPYSHGGASQQHGSGVSGQSSGQHFASYISPATTVEPGHTYGQSDPSMRDQRERQQGYSQTHEAYRRPSPRLAPLAIPYPQPFSFDAHGYPSVSPGYRVNADATSSAMFGADAAERERYEEGTYYAVPHGPDDDDGKWSTVHRPAEQHRSRQSTGGGGGSY